MIGTRRFLLAAAGLAVAGLVGAGVARAEAESARVREVRPDARGATILVALAGRREVVAGQSVEVRRGERTVGYGAVEEVFTASDLAVAVVGTVVADAAPLRVGDEVVFLDGRYRPGSRTPEDDGRPAAAPAVPPASAEPQQAGAPRAPAGQVLSVRDGVVLLDVGRAEGLQTGDRVSLRRDDREVGRIRIELLGAHTAGGMLVSGQAAVGTRAVSLGPAPAGRDLDFVALDFLGVVADLEHPTPHRSACHVGVPVRRVVPGSPAARSGIGRRDRVISVDGQIVRDVVDIRDRAEARTSSRVRVVVIRGDRLVELDVVFE